MDTSPTYVRLVEKSGTGGRTPKPVRADRDAVLILVCADSGAIWVRDYSLGGTLRLNGIVRIPHADCSVLVLEEPLRNSNLLNEVAAGQCSRRHKTIAARAKIYSRCWIPPMPICLRALRAPDISSRRIRRSARVALHFKKCEEIEADFEKEGTTTIAYREGFNRGKKTPLRRYSVRTFSKSCRN